MLRISCPFCGVRDEVEFRYRGDASLSRPDGGDAAALHAYTYERDNRRGWILEWWQHVGGCRRTLKVRRHSLTHAVSHVGEPAAVFPDEAGEPSP